MREKFARWNVLFVQYLKRDWKKNIIWILGLGLFAGAYVPAFEEIGKGQGLLGMYETMRNPAMISMVGPTPIEKAADYTLGAMYANEMLLFCGLFAMIMAALHVVSHTRKEEDHGLTELVRSFQVGRQANSLAVMMEIIIINILLALSIGVVMTSFGAATISTEGSFLFGASIGIAGILGASIALVMAQIMPTSSGATGSSLGIVGLLYIVRAGTDVSNVSLSMLNPMGWTYLTYPFTKNNWYPLIYAIVFCILVVVMAFALEGGRDMGAGYLPEREGRATAKKSLLSIPGLFMKLNKGVIISWSVAFVIMGAAYGSIYGDMQTFIEGNEMVSKMFMLAGVSLEESFTGTIMMVMIGLVSILPIAIVNKLFSEEVRLHLSQLYSTKVTRTQLYFTSVIIAIIAGVVGILLASVGLGGTAISAMGDSSVMNIGDFIAAGYNFLPSVLFFVGLAALALGFAPKLGKIVYVYLGYSFALNYFGGILDLPEWFSKTAIQSWIPHMPVEKFDGTIFATITVISIALIVLGYIGYRKRDMIEGA
ncbi:ABC-2 type transport system permease protein [Clostridium punense]|uniref:ABC-2 type transport system permease protein n=1 Tax=Clostridium punense TaxID=1054297 RepID=A0ABS4K4I1_9CLOT|nr:MULTISPECIES: tetronasin resistance protein [Clostridium]EQB87737.1 tetronasin resistance transmembrane protein [Clostridium sp. BL8]MBP2021544.1 ABC-2 type transport system permease protein [Clostridium punense]